MKKYKIKHGYVPYDRSAPQKVDWSKAIINPSMPKLNYSTENITLRMPKSLLERIKMYAHQHDVPYQSLIKILLSDALDTRLSKA
ncbi:MAG: CopG family antitoxin [Verrucomicrobiota bacterium]